VDGVVVAMGQTNGLPEGMRSMRFQIATAQYRGSERLIALDAVDAQGIRVGVRLTGAQVMNVRVMRDYIAGGPGEVRRYEELVSAIANDPSVPADSRGVPGSIYQSNINVPLAGESLPVGGTHRPAPTGHPDSRDDRESPGTY
jgi:hypothetical protein